MIAESIVAGGKPDRSIAARMAVLPSSIADMLLRSIERADSCTYRAADNDIVVGQNYSLSVVERSLRERKRFPDLYESAAVRLVVVAAAEIRLSQPLQCT